MHEAAPLLVSTLVPGTWYEDSNPSITFVVRCWKSEPPLISSDVRRELYTDEPRAEFKNPVGVL